MIYGEVVPQRRKILLVEDNLADAKLAIKIFKETDDSHEVIHVIDGEKAMSYLRLSAQGLGESQPDLVILDLNLPGKNGREILAEIKNHEDLKHIPVIILTSSDSDSDIYESFKAHANSYVKKSVDLFEFIEVLRSFKKFWLQSAKLPRALS
jgi:chemotaxis family two-component system response regulator Rcp1